jgi:hypothetical protein
MAEIQSFPGGTKNVNGAWSAGDEIAPPRLLRSMPNPAGKYLWESVDTMNLRRRRHSRFVFAHDPLHPLAIHFPAARRVAPE